MNIILCGFHWTGCKALQILLEHATSLFVYTHTAPEHIPSLESYCKKLNIGYSLENISDSTLPFKPDLICSIYYRNIISEKIIQQCDHKIFNLHPSLLPKYRGCSSLTWALINGEKEAGFTYHYIDQGCDTGNIIIQKAIQIEDFDTQESLYVRVMIEAMKSFPNALELVVSGFPGEKQQGQASYYRRGCPYNGEIDDSWPPEVQERFIRAMTYPPYPPATYKGIPVHSYEQLLQLLTKNK